MRGPGDGRAAGRHARPRLLLAGLLLAAAGPSLAQTLVLPALPEIQHEYAASRVAAAFVVTGFLLSAAVATPLVGKLGDVYGRGRLLTGVVCAFALGSTVCATADSIEVLVAGRVLQGTAAGVYPLAFGIIRENYPPERVPPAIGAVSATFGVGAALGLVLSGVIVDSASPAILFWLGLLILPAAVMVGVALPRRPTVSRATVDWAGAMLLSAALVCLLLGISKANHWGWTSLPVLNLIAGGLGIVAVWAKVEGRVARPLVDMRLRRDRPVLMSNLTGLSIGFAMFAAFVLVPQLVQAPRGAGYGLSASATEAGLLMALAAVAMVVAGPVAGFLSCRTSGRVPLALGSFLVTMPLAALAAADDSPGLVVVALVLLGAGVGFVFASMANIVVDAVPQDQVGVAAGINTVTRTVGGALGGQVAAAIVAAATADGASVPVESGYTRAFLVAALLALVGLTSALRVPSRRGEI